MANVDMSEVEFESLNLEMTQEEYNEDFKNRIENGNPYPQTLQELKDIMGELLLIAPCDDEIYDIILACALDRRLAGDPVWLQVIAPSGMNKTGVSRSLRKIPGMYPIDSITPKTLISGLTQKNKDTGEMEPVGGIIDDLDGQTMLVKDGTGILSMRPEIREAIFSDFRLAYDGYFSKGFGTLKKPIESNSTFGCIWWLTPAVDRYSNLARSLGERFVRTRYHGENRLEVTRTALMNMGKEPQMRETLANATANYTEILDFETPIQVADEYVERLVYMSLYGAIMRTHVFTKSFKGTIYEMDTPTVEAPTRLSKQLLKLGQLVCVVRQKTVYGEQEHQTLCRVAKDCAVPTRQKIVDYLMSLSLGYLASVHEVSEYLNLGWNPTKSNLEKMRVLKIVDDVDGKWRLSEYIRDIITRAKLYPTAETIIEPTTLDGLTNRQSIEAVFSYLFDHSPSREVDMIADLDVKRDDLRRFLKVLKQNGQANMIRPGVWTIQEASR